MNLTTEQIDAIMTLIERVQLVYDDDMPDAEREAIEVLEHLLEQQTDRA